MGNPFSPSAGFAPPQLVDRESILFEFERALEDGPGSEGRFVRISGERGMGKTVLLEAMATRAAGRGWNTVTCEANEDCAAYVHDRLEDLADTALDEVSLGLGPISATLKARDLSTVTLRRLFEIYFERGGAPLFLALDEVQDGFASQLRAVVQAARASYGAGQEIFIALAGLPSMIEKARGTRGLTFLHRALGRNLGPLDLDRVRDSYAATFADQGLQITAEALAQLTEATEGHPYMMQILGRRLWDIWDEAGRTIMGPQEVSKAIQAAEPTFQDAVSDVMVGECSERERQFLRCLLALGGHARTSQVAEAMGYADTETSSAAQKASMVRRSLIQKGLIGAPQRGFVAFAGEAVARSVAQVPHGRDDRP